MMYDQVGHSVTYTQARIQTGKANYEFSTRHNKAPQTRKNIEPVATQPRALHQYGL